MSVAAMLAGLWAPRRPRPPAPGIASGGGAAQRVATFVSTGRSHVGRVRSINEDRVLDRGDAGLWAIIDGMGGHDAGDLAADTALAALNALADRGTVTPGDVEAALVAVNAALHAAGQAAGRVRGATAIVLVRDATRFWISWVGDCRAYRRRDGAFAQLTRDHSVVQELVDAGQLTAAQAVNHPRSNVVTRALGAAPTVLVETMRFESERDDLVLLCSDGLTRSLAAAPPQLQGRPLAGLADELIATALDRDGRDNISLVLVAAAD